MYERIETWETRRATAAGTGGAIASQHWRASEAGSEILRAGGNAADAAVACAFAVGVCEPWMSGLGGSGLAVIWDAASRRATAVDFQGNLPASIDIADYPLDPAEPETLLCYPGVRGRRNIEGGSAATVPGAVRGLAELHANFGRLGFDTILKPAIRIADEGLPVDWHATLMIAIAMGSLRKFPSAAAVFLPDGAPPEPPNRISVPAFAKTLRTLAEKGPEEFYSGELSETIAADLASAGSKITSEDLDAYRAVWREAPAVEHRGAHLHTAGEASGGPRLGAFLTHIQDRLRPEEGPRPTAHAVHAEALRAAWMEHKQRTGQENGEGGCTTHLSACDAEGSMVAITYTLLNRFGSRVLLPKTGILMNNSVGYFDPRPGRPISIAPGKRVGVSNMCPVVGVRDGRSQFALGASGANRIVPAVAQIVSFLLDWEMDLERALHAPRIDVDPDGMVRVDPRLGRETLALIKGETEFAQHGTLPKNYACPQAVMRQGKTFAAVADPSHPSAGSAAA